MGLVEAITTWAGSASGRDRLQMIDAIKSPIWWHHEVGPLAQDPVDQYSIAKEAIGRIQGTYRSHKRVGEQIMCRCRRRPSVMRFWGGIDAVRRRIQLIQVFCVQLVPGWVALKRWSTQTTRETMQIEIDVGSNSGERCKQNRIR